MVTGQRSRQRVHDLTPMRDLEHVDEIDDDDPAQVAQPQLARDRYRSFEVGSKNGLFQIAVTDIGPRVDVHGGERFGLVDDQVTTRLELDLAVQRLADIVLDPEQVEDRAGAGIELDPRRQLRHEIAGKLHQLRTGFLLVDTHVLGLRACAITQHAHCQRQVLMHQRRHAGLAGPGGNQFPQTTQEQQIGTQ